MVKSIISYPHMVPGEYDGIMSASILIIQHDGWESEEVKMNQAIRCFNCKCKVTVDEQGWITVKF
jgi:hypothetical protein